MLKLLISLLPVFILTPAICQVSVSGIITDSSQKKLSYATIILTNKNNTYSAITDSLGFFDIKDISKGQYSLECSLVNYQKESMEINLQKDTTVSLQLIQLVRQLKDVVVSSNGRLLERYADRYIFNPENLINLQGKKTTDLLALSPGTMIKDGSLSMPARDGVKVFINNIEVFLSGKELMNYLNTIPPEQIKSIEIIPIPSSLYDAAGNVGVINIITKKNIQPGIKGGIRSDFHQTSYPGLNQSVYLNYRAKSFNIYSNLGGYYLPYKNITKSTYSYPASGTYNYNPRKQSNSCLSSNIIADYSIKKGTNAGLQYIGDFISNERTKDLENRMDFISDNQKKDSSIFTDGITTEKGNQHNLSLYFDRTYNTNNHTRIEVSLLRNTSDNKRPFSSQAQSYQAVSPKEFYQSTGFQNNNIYTGKIDQEGVTYGFRWSAGIKASFINNKSGSSFYNAIGETYHIDSSLSNTFVYKERIQAIYASISKQVKDFSFKLGLRTEFTQTRGTSYAAPQTNNNNYTNLFPTFFSSYQFKNQNSIFLSYGKRIDRPQFDYLDPFKWYINKYSYAEGNPFLRPAFSHSVEIGYSLYNNWNFKIYYSKKENGFGRIVLLNKDSLNSQRQYVENYLDYYTSGINIYKYINAADWLESILQIDLSYQKYGSINPSFREESGWSGDISSYNSIYFGKSQQIKASLNIQETLPGIYNYRRRENSLSLDFGLSYAPASKRFELGMYITDILKTSAPKFWYTVNNVQQVYRNYYDNRRLEINFIYRFGNRYIKIDNERESANEAEKARIK
ncbi:outer membrane beta-barrel protein [Filimonas effusa]|uniref:TonB-dependent receptor n=1 Tax=Filimonas effusa TaxID=2508721 RepID=A0A4Q1DAR1_9BACT|nr:outer membrane beta-barrel protein [Filimonas effusa]RXK85855.1 TonB-dependent receptor [Filimonas effusa]